MLVWLAPAFVWATVFFIQEDRIRLEGSSRGIDEIDMELLLVAYGVCAIWMLVGLLWFKRRRLDGTALFARGARWSGVLGTLGLAGIFTVCGYETWKSDVYLPAIGYRVPRAANITMEAPRVATIAQRSMLKVEFEVAVDGIEVVIDFDDGKVVNFSPAHHGIMVQLSEPPGTYQWKAMLKGEHVASGEVTLISGQLVEIQVPRPTLRQLIAGRWESDPEEIAVDWGGEDQDSSDMQVELEFENDLATMAVRESSSVERSQHRVRIDESVTPALIDLLLPDGQQLIGIARFQAGHKSHFQRRGQHMVSPMVPGESEMTMTAEGMGDGSDYEGGAFPGAAPSMGFGAPGMVKPSEPDRLVLCVTQGSGLRPWEFQADEERGHMVFSLVRSRESGSLRAKLALNPVSLETSQDMTMQSVQAWSKKLNIEAEGTNSVGMEMVLVPPAAYHLVDPPHLATLRRELPEPSPVRDDPDFKYEFPPKLKQQITKRHKVVSYPFVMSRRMVTTEQFRQFIDETGYVTDAERGTSEKSASPPETKGGWHQEGRLFNWADGLSWKNPISVDEEVKGLNLPVSMISWRDATEFCKWLSEKEGRQYRLPKNEEWTAAMQLGAARKQLPATNSDEP
ncbi:MAG: sulfatase activating formylglycine-generating enzyme, partial [Porticoccaceae bacterium]